MHSPRLKAGAASTISIETAAASALVPQGSGKMVNQQMGFNWGWRGVKGIYSNGIFHGI